MKPAGDIGGIQAKKMCIRDSLHGLKNVENKVRIDLLLQGPEFRLLKQHLLIETLVDHLIHLSGHGNDLRSKIVNFIVKGAGIWFCVTPA